jgi:hypothetical protein
MDLDVSRIVNKAIIVLKVTEIAIGLAPMPLTSLPVYLCREA